jgi:putative nucleotidyltransferase with HDIG domain
MQERLCIPRKGERPGAMISRASHPVSSSSLVSRAPRRPWVDAAAARKIDGLIDRAAAADSSFRAHSGRVTALAVRIGRELGLSSEELDLLEIGAAAHDVGKLAVPAEIISKPGPLVASEWRAIHDHPAAGAKLVAACGAPTSVVEIVHGHHERWDGHGYPSRRREAETALGARIVAVADAYCAMIEPRPYRIARAPQAARDQLLAHAGTQFDPKCAAAAWRVTAPAPPQA